MPGESELFRQQMHKISWRFVSEQHVPRFDGKKAHLWSSRFQSFLASRGLIRPLEPTSDPIWIVGV